MTTDHPGDGRLQAYLDGELAMDAAEAVERHLLRCPPCQARLDDLRRAEEEVSEALTLLDGSSDRPGDREALLWELRRRSGLRRSGRHRERLAAAAVVVLLLGAGAAAAMPGSPVRDWLFGSDEGAPASLSTPEAVPSDPGPALSLELQAGEARIEVEGFPSSVPIEVRTAARARAEVDAPVGASFQAGPGWVRVTGGSGEGILRIELPETARSVRIEVDGRPRAELSEGRLRVDGNPVGDETGDETGRGWTRIPHGTPGGDEGGRTHP